MAWTYFARAFQSFSLKCSDFKVFRVTLLGLGHMHFSLTKSSFVVVMAAVILLATTGPALASTPLAPTATGFDVSFPSALSRYLRRPALASWA